MADRRGSWARKNWLLASCAVVGMLLPAVGLAQTETKPAAAPGEAQLPVPISPSIVENLLRLALAPSRPVEAPANQLPFEAIRNKRNIFQGTLLGGFSSNVSDQQEFHRAVSDLARQDEERGLAATSEFALPPAEQLVPTNPVQAATEQLRASARNLDAAAADLEDAGNYAAADRLRSSAQRLRREARDLARQPAAEAGGEVPHVNR